MFGDVGDLIFGKKSEMQDLTPELTQNRKFGAEYAREGLRDFSKLKPTKEGLQGQAEIEKQAVRTGTQDTLRRLRELRASRGQVGTSLGMGQEKSLIERGAKTQSQIQASLPERLRLLREQFNTQKANMGMGLMGFNTERYKTAGSSGLLGAGLEMGGGILGGMFGGSGGAQAGASGGKQTGTAISGLFQ